MGRHKDYQADLFNEFEKLNKKLDKLIKENKEQSLTIYNLNLEIEKLNKTIQEKDKKIEELIKEKKIKVKTIVHTIYGKTTKKDITKYKLGIEINPYVEKHIFKHDINSKSTLPPEFYTDVTYDTSIKALSIELGVHNVISYDRLSDFFSVLTKDIFKISNGTLVNFLYEFSAKSESNINKLVDNLLNSNCIYTDETSSKFNKKNSYVRNYSTEDIVIYKRHKPIEEDNILPLFCGGIMGDHDTTLQKYGTANYECNIHLGRYLEELIQNIPEIEWPIKMKELFFRINNTRKIASVYGLNKFDSNKTKECEKEYDDLIKKAKEENKSITSTFYRDKANKLYRRLIKYKKNHLAFIKNFSIPFDNNLSESDLRIFKIKTKVSGGFRSLKGIRCFLNALSIIKTSIKRNINPFDSITAIFNNKILFSN